MAEAQTLYDIGEEIISRLNELIAKLNKIIEYQNEKDYQNPLLDRNRS